MSKADFTGMTVVEKYTNLTMVNMLQTMNVHLQTAKGKFGYAIARNVRKIQDACTEYLQAQQELMAELGEEEKDENGNSTGNFSIKINTPACEEFVKRLEEYAYIEHTVEIYKIPYDILPDELTAKEMLDLEWMLYDDIKENR